MTKDITKLQACAEVAAANAASMAPASVQSAPASAAPASAQSAKVAAVEADVADELGIANEFEMASYPVDMRGRTSSSLTRHGDPLGTTVEIADASGRQHTVLTNEGTIDDVELARLKEEMLHGNGFVIAKGVVPPELCKTCRDDLLSRGPEARRTSDILKYNDAFSEVLVHTWDRLGPLMEGIMGPRCFLNGYISNNLPPGENGKSDAQGNRGASLEELQQRWKGGLHSDYPYHQGTAGHLDGKEPFTVQTIWFMSELDHENGGTRILPSSALWKRTPRRPRMHTLNELPEDLAAAQKELDEAKFVEESIPATGEPGGKCRRSVCVFFRPPHRSGGCQTCWSILGNRGTRRGSTSRRTGRVWRWSVSGSRCTSGATRSSTTSVSPAPPSSAPVRTCTGL